MKQVFTAVMNIHWLVVSTFVMFPASFPSLIAVTLTLASQI